MSSGGGGWLMTKKRGRDDKEIALDQQRALDLRKAQHRGRRELPKNSNRHATAKGTKRTKNNDLQDFII